MPRRVVPTVLAVASLFTFAGFAKKPPQMPAGRKIEHALNRLTFGPRPGDSDAVKRIGLKKWIERQLHPDSIPENPVLEAKLQPLDTLRMTPAEIARKYPPPQLIKAMVDGRMPYPSDPETRYMIRKLVERYQQKLGMEDKVRPSSLEQTAEKLTPDQHRAFDQGTVQEKIKLLRSLGVEEQYSVLDAMPPAMRQKLFVAAPPDLRRKIERLAGPQQIVVQDLIESKLDRAVYSNRQLQEVLTDFWFNHFNVFLDKGIERYMIGPYERDAIRLHVLGKFKDLLLATAESPAMLFYLDNWQSAGPNQNPKRPKAKSKRGLNENYGRELMELHTLGVDGGYTQHDVTEVARCFTGWTIREPRRGGGFEFNPRMHDDGEKVVLGVTIPGGGGMEDGLKVIDILSHHPSTARFISKSLAIRFVSDNPPERLIERMAATFTKTDGDLRQVMRTMINSPEFWAESAYHAKVKTPLEMVASSIRATGADIDFSFALTRELNEMGEPLYRKQEPTGYSNKSSEWVNSAALLGRMNFALALANSKLPGVTAEISDPQAEAIALGSPEFQKR